jgi:predicted O-methyltransferase YrrM
MLSLNDWIAQLFQDRKLLLMGHAQRQDDLNLGLGWLYYALGRIVRPSCVVVIGSYRGFAPLVFARALADNCEGGVVHFVDPSLVDDFWKDESRAQSHFASFGVTNIVHHPMTTQQFIECDAYRRLSDVGIVFIDGYHSAEQARFDFEAFTDVISPAGMVLFHDSVWQLPSWLYGPGREYLHTVNDFIAELKSRHRWQVLDIPFGDGVTVVRRASVPSPPNRPRCPVADSANCG